MNTYVESTRTKDHAPSANEALITNSTSSSILLLSQSGNNISFSKDHVHTHEKDGAKFTETAPIPRPNIGICITNKTPLILKQDAQGLTAILRKELTQNERHIPEDLKMKPCWLAWKLKFKPSKEKPDKLPFYPKSMKLRSGVQGSPSDVADLVTFAEAWSAFQSHTDIAGVGIATLPQFNVIALDIDGCIQTNDGERTDTLPRDVWALLETTHVEISPSGTGYRAIWEGNTTSVKNNPEGFELFGSTGFVTITGNSCSSKYSNPSWPLPRIEGTALQKIIGWCTSEGKIAQQITTSHEPGAASMRSELPTERANTLARVNEQTIKDLWAAAQVFDADDVDSYDDWVTKVGLPLASLKETAFSDHGRKIFHHLSALSDKYERDECDRKWHRNLNATELTFKTIFWLAQKKGWAKPNQESGADLSASAGLSHPYAQFIEYDLTNFESDAFILDDLITEGISAIFGAPGVGKSTMLVPLLARAAGLCDPLDELTPTLRRYVIYATEDAAQVQKILRSMIQSGEILADEAEIKHWFKIVEAKRLPAKELVKVAKEYLSEGLVNIVLCADGSARDVMPVVALDTAPATIHLESENDNSEISSAVSTLKSEFSGISVILVGHMAKTLKNTKDAALMSGRGGGAWEGDVRQVMYLFFLDDETRWLEIGTPQVKHRFLTKWAGISFSTETNTVQALDPLKRIIDINLVHSKPKRVLLEEFGSLKTEEKMPPADATALLVNQHKLDVLTFIKIITDDGDWIGKSMSGTTANNINKRAWRTHPKYPEILRPNIKKNKTIAFACVTALIEDGLLIHTKRFCRNIKGQKERDKVDGIWLTSKAYAEHFTSELIDW